MKVQVNKPCPTSQPKLWCAVQVRDGKFLNDNEFCSESFWMVALVAALRWGWVPSKPETSGKLKRLTDRVKSDWCGWDQTTGTLTSDTSTPSQPLIDSLCDELGLN